MFLTRTSAQRASAADAGSLAFVGDSVLARRDALPALQNALAARRLVFTPRGEAVAGLSMSSNERIALVAGEIGPRRPILARARPVSASDDLPN